MAALSHAIPVSAGNSPHTPPAGGQIAEIFWVTADGQIVDQLTRVPVQNGIALYQGPPRPQGLSWAIRITEELTGAAAFRSGPLLRLPGPPSDVFLKGRVRAR
jgi:hypothetical protein